MSLKRIFAVVCLSLVVRHGMTEDRILERLDHVLAESEQSEELFAVFSKTLQLPIAWPHESYDGFASGGVSVGGSVLEVISLPDSLGATSFSGIAYVPVRHIPEVREQLESTGAALGINHPYTVAEDGETRVLWETFKLEGVSSPGLTVFVCDYKYRANIDENRERARSELQSRDGGPLGVVGLAEILVGTPDVSARVEEWSKLNLQKDSDARFAAGDGAHIKLVEHPEDTILRITLKVRSISHAADWLSDQGLLGSKLAGSVQIAPDAVQGLSVYLVD